jgi:signal transduction histidine kinase
VTLRALALKTCPEWNEGAKAMLLEKDPLSASGGSIDPKIESNTAAQSTLPTPGSPKPALHQNGAGPALERSEGVDTALGTLAAGLAHELRTPLSTISLNLQLLQEELQTVVGSQPQADTTLNGKAEVALKRVCVLQKEIQRLEEVLSDFLRFAKGGSLELLEQDINQVVDEVIDFIAPEAKRNGIEVVRDYAPDLPIVRLDTGLIKQAILNIIINAQQAMPQGGRLSVSTSHKEGHVHIEVTDTGTGIPRHHQDKIFQAYFSTKKKGTGLGLPTAKRIVEGHGGSISVESTEGRGSSFIIQLPLGTGPLKPLNL